jgi:DNA-directed RNA polymerase subunit N (RpoN/RPB10)
MIIPVKCVTCGAVLADKYRYYLNEVRKRKMEKGGATVQRTVYLTATNAKKTPEAEVLDELQLFNPCCRRHMLTHVDIE